MGAALLRDVEGKEHLGFDMGRTSMPLGIGSCCVRSLVGYSVSLWVCRDVFACGGFNGSGSGVELDGVNVKMVTALGMASDSTGLEYEACSGNALTTTLDAHDDICLCSSSQIGNPEFDARLFNRRSGNTCHLLLTSSRFRLVLLSL